MVETTHPVDVSVGRAVRAERKARGFSQERLAKAIGVSFQQLQKYERGSNRISASKLHDIAATLEVPVTLFFTESGRRSGRRHGSVAAYEETQARRTWDKTCSAEATQVFDHLG